MQNQELKITPSQVLPPIYPNRDERMLTSSAMRELDDAAMERIEMKRVLVDVYRNNAHAITHALLERCLAGEVKAIQEFHNRVFGKSVQPIDAEVSQKLKIYFDPVFNEQVLKD